MMVESVATVCNVTSLNFLVPKGTMRLKMASSRKTFPKHVEGSFGNWHMDDVPCCITYFHIFKGLHLQYPSSFASMCTFMWTSGFFADMIWKFTSHFSCQRD
jgi:hypothetical protein